MRPCKMKWEEKNVCHGFAEEEREGVIYADAKSSIGG